MPAQKTISPCTGTRTANRSASCGFILALLLAADRGAGLADAEAPWIESMTPADELR